MSIKALLSDKSIKGKEKTEIISKWLLDDSLSAEELIAVVEKVRVADKAICIESLEYVTKTNPEMADENVLGFITKMLLEESPRIKWESAKVIGNVAHLFPAKLKKAINNLLINSDHEGTVVRWSTAFALGEILKLKTKHNADLLAKMENLHSKEVNNGVRKKYFDAMKMAKKVIG